MIIIFYETRLSTLKNQLKATKGLMFLYLPNMNEPEIVSLESSIESSNISGMPNSSILGECNTNLTESQKNTYANWIKQELVSTCARDSSTICKAEISAESNVCSDGTLDGKCSTTKPKYCDNGKLIDNYELCGDCSPGQKQSCSISIHYNSKSIPGEKTCENGIWGDCKVINFTVESTGHFSLPYCENRIVGNVLCKDFVYDDPTERRLVWF